MKKRHQENFSPNRSHHFDKTEPCSPGLVAAADNLPDWVGDLPDWVRDLPFSAGEVLLTLPETRAGLPGVAAEVPDEERAFADDLLWPNETPNRASHPIF